MKKDHSTLAAQPEISALSWRGLGLAAAVLGVMLLLVFGDLMLAGGNLVVSKAGCDIYSGALAGREFTFNQLRQGTFLLWNPVLLSGCPNFGGFQSWLVYPLAFPHLFLSTVAAINWIFILHTFLGGMFMYVWLGRQSLHRYACLAGALMFAFCGPLYLRLYAGHPTVHATIVWIPLVFLAIEGLILKPSLGWWLLGTTAVSMQLLAGYPQVLFYTAIAAGFYTLARLPEAPKLWKSILLLGLMNVLVLGLTCVQWAAAMAMAEECVRKGGVPYDFAAMFSLPPENWLTLIRPGLLGDMEKLPYWGRCYLWEMCLYFGTIGLFFSVVGLWHSRRRHVLTVAGIGVILAVLALGCHSPHFRFFYEHVPGFNMFRSNSKFVIPLVVFLIFLSAHGMDLLFRKEYGKKVVTGMLLGAVAACAGLATASGLIMFCPPAVFAEFMAIPLNSREVYLNPNAFSSPEAVTRAATFTANELGLAMLFLGALTVALYLFRRRPEWRRVLAPAVVGLLAVELLLFAWREHVSFPPEIVRMPQLQEMLEKNLGDGRVFSPDGSNLALAMNGVNDMWGYGSDAVIRRYAEFLAFTQGENPDEVTGYQQFRKLHPRFDLLRCKFVLIPQPDGSRKIMEAFNPLPRFLLLTDWRAVEKRDDVFAEISRLEFDPRQTVLLERPPAPDWVAAAAAPAPPELADPKSKIQNPKSAPGTVRLLRETTNWQEVEVTLSQPAILLQTDLFTPNWHVYALPGSSQTHYELIPADYILRSVPLLAGTHRLRIEYRPTAFVTGKWVSLASLALFAGIAAVWLAGRWRRRGRTPAVGITG